MPKRDRSASESGGAATTLRLGRRPTGAMGAGFAGVIVAGLLGLALALVGMMGNARLRTPDVAAQLSDEAAAAADGTPILLLGAALMVAALLGWRWLKRRIGDKTLTLSADGLALVRGAKRHAAGWSDVIGATWSTRDDLSESRQDDEGGVDDAWVVEIALADGRRLTVEGLDAWEPGPARAALRRYLDRHAGPA